MEKILAWVYGEEVLRSPYDARREPRISTSKLLPEILRLMEQGWSYRLIGEKLGFTRNSVEHVVVRHRKSQGKQQNV